MQILVVDNDEAIRTFMHMQLEEAGHAVKSAEDGLSALNILETYSPDVIFIDLIMPNIDGKKLCRMLRNDEKYNKTFLVVLSAISTEESIDFESIGFNASIAKGPLKSVGEHVFQVLEELSAKGEEARGISFENNHLSQRGITKELLSSKKHFELILSNMSECIFEMTYDGIIIYTNEAAVQNFGLSEEEMLAKPFISIFEEDQKSLVGKMLEEVKEVRMLKHMNPPVKVNDQLLTIDLLAVIDDARQTMFAILNNRTEQIKAENVLKEAHKELEHRVAERTKEIAAINDDLQKEITERKKIEKKIHEALTEKEILLKEIHHRVKNNLQIISSLLGLQARQVNDPDLVQKFTETQNRIHSISVVHEKLYQSKDFSKILFEEYIDNIIMHLDSTFGEISENIKIIQDIEKIRIGIDLAIPCGLIINELVSNAVKHAFPDKKKGEIEISFKKENKEKYLLRVRDNGKGMQKNEIAPGKNSLGMRIIDTLVRQLNSTLEADLSNGTNISIHIPAPKGS